MIQTYIVFRTAYMRSLIVGQICPYDMGYFLFNAFDRGRTPIRDIDKGLASPWNDERGQTVHILVAKKGNLAARTLQPTPPWCQQFKYFPGRGTPSSGPNISALRSYFLATPQNSIWLLNLAWRIISHQRPIDANHVHNVVYLWSGSHGQWLNGNGISAVYRLSLINCK